MDDVSGFLRRWRAFVRQHAAADEAGRAALIRRVLDDGLATLDLPEADGADGADDEADEDQAVRDRTDRLECERDLVAASGSFDAFGYFWHHPDLPWYLCGHDEQLRHYLTEGWRQLRHPHPGFDLWWYWLTYLDPSSERLNPLVHYLAQGRHLGHATLPTVQPQRPLTPAPAGRPRRICLFAGFDADGIVDDTVVAYLRDLSRFADVYYLADCILEAGELDKLAPYTQGRWAIRHGRYDFGSYSMLARDLVGWDVVETYDELLLANDSCYLVQPFDAVFERMDSAVGDWWGLQATYDAFTKREFDLLGRPLGLDEVEDAMRVLDVWRYSDFIHVGSYFVAFRRPVIADPEFRRRLDTVAEQSDKTTIIMKYEIGFSRYLILAGYHLATFVDGILPYHPVYRASAFDLMGDGFPLLKRQFLYENPFSTPDLAAWKTRVLAVAPGADVATIERNLVRVAPAWSLHRSFSVRTLPNGSVALPEPIGPEAFDDEERWAPKFAHWWAFSVDPVTGRLEGSSRAVFEAVRHDPSIKKLLLLREGSPRLGGANVVALPVDSPPGQHYLLRAGQIFVSRGPRADVGHPLSGDRHQYVGLGRGTPLLAFGAAEPVRPGEAGLTRHHTLLHDLDLTRAVLAPSTSHAQAMRESVSSPFGPPTWVTGTPRTDLLLAPEETLPDDLRRQVVRLRRLLAGRRLVVWAPLDAESRGGPVPTLGNDPAWLTAWAERHGAVVGERLPPGTPTQGLLDLAPDRFPDVETVLRVADALVSDYTSELADFLVTGRPVIAFTPDLDAVTAWPGLLRDLDTVVPGGVRRDEHALHAALETLFDEPTAEQAADYARSRDLLHDHLDDRSAARVVRRVQETYLPIEEWLTDDP